MGENPRMLKVVRVVAELHTDVELVHELAEAELIQLERDVGGEALISEEDAERVRLVHLLTSDLDVNLAGVEVILHMRETMVAMQRQLQEILEAVAEEMRARGTH
jgi:MerR family transcriptional regulator/heat shock protein HspR